MPKEVGPSDLYSPKELKGNFLPFPWMREAEGSCGCSDLLALLAQASLFFP